MNRLPITHTWPPLLPVDIALELAPLDEILESHDITPGAWTALLENDTFRRELMRTRKEMAENGMSFRAKAKIQAEMYLLDMDKLMVDPDVSPAVKVDLFKSMVKYAALEPPKEETNPGGVNVSGYNVQIVLGGN